MNHTRSNSPSDDFETAAGCFAADGTRLSSAELLADMLTTPDSLAD